MKRNGPDEEGISDSDRDSLHTVHLSIIPLQTPALQRARLIKNNRLESVVELFKEETKKLWWFAYYALVKIGPPAVPRLSLALKDKSEDIRKMAAECLEVIAELNGGEKSGAAVPFLREALADESQFVRRNVAQALGKFGPSASAAVPDLVARIEHDEDHHVRSYSARSLGRIGPDAKAAISVLKELERSGDDQLRKIAAEALVKIQGE